MTVAPSGRLTLTQGVAVPGSDDAGATTIYYIPVAGDEFDIYDGADFSRETYSELTLVLDGNSSHAGYHQGGKIFDLFLVIDGAAVKLGTGPAWTSDTSRGQGSGTTELQALRGLWTNKNAMTLRYGAAAGDTVSLAVNRALYVGSFYATSDGQATDSAARRLLYNAYNQDHRHMYAADPVDSFYYSTPVWRQFNNSAANQLDVLFGLGSGHMSAHASAVVISSTSSFRQVFVGIGIDSDAVNSAQIVSYQSPSSGDPRNGDALFEGPVGLGRHVLKNLQRGNGGDTQQWFGTNSGTNLFKPGIIGKVMN